MEPRKDSQRDQWPPAEGHKGPINHQNPEGEDKGELAEHQNPNNFDEVSRFGIKRPRGRIKPVWQVKQPSFNTQGKRDDIGSLSRGQLTSHDSPDPTCKLTKLSRQETKELQQSAENPGEQVTETLVVQENQGEEEQLPEKTSKEVAIWQRLHEVLEQEPKFNMVAKQEDIMAILEGVEPSSPEGTLQYWLMEHMYQTLTNEEDDTIGCQEAIQDILAQLKTPQTGVKDVKCVQANVTSFKSEVKTWLSNQEVHFACLQETHLTETKMQEMTVSLHTLGYQVWGVPAAPTAGGTTGGLMCVAKKHVNFRYFSSFSIEGKGCQILIGRFAGKDLAIGNIYLQSGTGPTSPMNVEILSWLASQLERLQCAWMIMGDWNTEAREMQHLSFGEEVKGEWLMTGQSTIQSGNELDFILVSSCLRSLVEQRVEWKVPFRPHAAVFQTLHWSQGQVPILQIDKTSITEECQTKEVKILLENLSEDEHSIRFARCTGKIGIGLSQTDGKSRNVRCIRKPLLAPQSQGWIWAGEKASLLVRLEVMLAMQDKKPLEGRQWGVLSKLAASLQDITIVSEGVDWKAMAAAIVDLVASKQQLPPEIREVLKNLSEHEEKTWQDQRTKEYKEWLQGATDSYLRPLFRSIKKPEQTLVRPFRELPAEIRPHERRKQWAKVWKPNPGNLVVETPIRHALREAAKAEAKAQGKAFSGDLERVAKKMKKKAPGPDGWTIEFLKSMEENGINELTQEMKEWEVQGKLPGQVCITLITMLAKNEKAERPIGLTHYAYRAWARTKWPQYEEWARSFELATPWDQAKKGVSSLDVALARIIRHETARSQKRSGVTLLLDLEAFYENIQHERLMEQGLQQKFPSMILNAAMDVYQGPRYLEGEGALSAPIRSTKGIIAGCPFAPGLSKLILQPVIEPLWGQKYVRHIDVWLDDVGIDAEAPVAEVAARRGKELYVEVKNRLLQEGLTLSAKKTVFIVTDAKTRKALQGYLEPGDPEIKYQAKDLGLDTSGGGLRRIATARGRQAKARQRKNKLTNLKVGNVNAQIRIFRGSIMTAGLYGHQAMGVAPKRMKWYRHAMAGLLGRQSLGGTDVVLDMQSKEGDPACTIHLQHFTSLARIIKNWPQAHKGHLQKAWEATWVTLKKKQYPWKTAAGPLGAAVTYLIYLQWDAPKLNAWKQKASQEKSWDISQVKDMHEILHAMREQLVAARRERIAKSFECPELKEGIDWYGAKLSVKGLTNAKSCQTLWQGALRAGKEAWCTRCEQPCTYKHLLWDCKWWTENLPEPAKFAELRKKYQSQGLWTFGLNPKPTIDVPQTENLQWEGDWQEVEKNPHRFKWATDGTAGSSKDPRMQCHVWGVVVAEVHDQEIKKIAGVTGRVVGEQSVYRAEARAILFVAEFQQQHVLDVTTDSQSVCKRLQKKTLKGASMDLFERFEITKEFVDPFWINSHMDQDRFKAKFGEHLEWRRKLNEAADQLVGERARQERNIEAERDIKAKDAVARQINGLVAKRVQALKEYDKDQGPQVEWMEKPSKQQKTQNLPSQKTQEVRPSQKVIKGATFEKEQKLNKRQQLQRALDGGEHAKGHEWQELRRSRDNLTAKCKKCGLYIQQTEKPANFEAKIGHPCWSQEATAPINQYHETHKMSNAGLAWVCMECQGAHNIGGVVPQGLKKLCAGKKKKTDSQVYLLALAAQQASKPAQQIFGKTPVQKVFKPENTFAKAKAQGRQSKLQFSSPK